MGGFEAVFSEVPDPRASNARHDLLEVMFVALAAVLCGAEDCTDMAEFADAKLELLHQVVGLPHGPPMLQVARTHWTIENQLHWVLDVAFEEDRARSRKDNAPQNLALLRKLALNIARHHPAKGSMKKKLKRAGWDDAFLLSMLGHMR
jgi:hypothetical protein